MQHAIIPDRILEKKKDIGENIGKNSSKFYSLVPIIEPVLIHPWSLFYGYIKC